MKITIQHAIGYVVKNIYFIVLFFCMLCAALFLWWSYSHGYIVAYADAKSHLNITRRVFDNTTPGMAQLGGIWLPLLHVLMLPFVLHDSLYYSGLAGSVVNAVAYMITISVLFKTVYRVTKSPLAAAAATLLFGLNTNILYMQTTPMTEVLTIMLISLSIYFFVSWQQSKQIRQLVYLALTLFLGTLTRYEMWSLLPASIVAITITLITNRTSWRDQLTKIEGVLILFCSLAFLGVAMWFLWNILLFSDPFYFLKGIYSSKALQVELIRQGLHKPYHNLFISIQYYMWACVNTCGWFIIVSGVIGSMVYLFQKRTKNSMALILFAGAVIGFEIYSMYTGNTTIFVPQLYPYDYFNIRYGLYALPFFTVFTGTLLTGVYRSVGVGIFIVLLGSTVYQYLPLNPITLADSGFERARAEEHVAALLRKQYRGGTVMAAAGVADPIIFLSKIHIRYYITEGNQKAWHDALRNPSRTVNWIIINTNKENIRNEMARMLYTKHKLVNYDLAYKENDWELYRKKGDKPMQQSNMKETKKYKIVSGDSLWTIAERVYGDGNKWVELARANNVAKPWVIHANNFLLL